MIFLFKVVAEQNPGRTVGGPMKISNFRNVFGFLLCRNNHKMQDDVLKMQVIIQKMQVIHQTIQFIEKESKPSIKK